MTPEQIKLIKQSFGCVRLIADTAATLFYRRLFTLDPSLRPLFTDDLNLQGQRLITTLTLLVKGLDHIDTMLPVVQQLGERLQAYGLQPEHYATVGDALMWTLEQCLNEHFTPDVRAAWQAAYTLLADNISGVPA